MFSCEEFLWRFSNVDVNHIIEIHAPQCCTPANFCWIWRKDHNRFKVAEGLLLFLHNFLLHLYSTNMRQGKIMTHVTLNLRKAHLCPTITNSGAKEDTHLKPSLQFETISYHCQTTHTCKRWEDMHVDDNTSPVNNCGWQSSLSLCTPVCYSYRKLVQTSHGSTYRCSNQSYGSIAASVLELIKSGKSANFT